MSWVCLFTRLIYILFIKVIYYQIQPNSGPKEGGTLLTIDGQNLGSHITQVLNAVTVAGSPCYVVANRYQVSHK